MDDLFTFQWWWMVMIYSKVICLIPRSYSWIYWCQDANHLILGFHMSHCRNHRDHKVGRPPGPQNPNSKPAAREVLTCFVVVFMSFHVFSCVFHMFFFCVWLFSGWLQNCHVTNSKKLRESTNLRFQKGPKNPTARQIIGISGKSFHLHPHLNQESPGQGQTLVFDQGSQGWPWRMEKNCEKKTVPLLKPT